MTQQPPPAERLDPAALQPTPVMRAIDAVSELTLPPHHNQISLFDSLADAEEKARRSWPGGGPSGDGIAYFDEIAEIRLRRLRWRSRAETGGEMVWLAGKLVGVAACAGVAWEFLPR
jgi:hypothetical protein